MNFFQSNTLEYQHNRVAVVFLVPPLLLLFWSFESPYPLQTLIFLTLAVDAMVRANARELLSVFLWVSAAILTMVTGWFLLLDTPDEEDSGLTTLSILMRITGHCFLFLSAVRILTCCICTCILYPTYHHSAVWIITQAAWCTLQFGWLHSK